MRFVAAALAAMASVTALGLIVQRHLSYELLGVDGGAASWARAAGVLAALALLTCGLVSLPCAWIARRVPGLVAARPRLAAVLLAAAVTAVVYRFVAPMAQTLVDEVAVPALCVVYHAVFFAVLGRASSAGHSPRPAAAAPDR